jgi:hypothetical protein
LSDCEKHFVFKFLRRRHFVFKLLAAVADGARHVSICIHEMTEVKHLRRRDFAALDAEQPHIVPLSGTAARRHFRPIS